MRVHGYWPLRLDRAITLPIRWVDWLTTDDDDDDGDTRDSDDGAGDGGDGDGDNGDGGGRGQVGRGRGEQGGRGRGGNNETSRRLLRSCGPHPGSSASGKVFIQRNRFTNPASLKALKKSFAKQPNWKAAVMAGTTWEGNADENAAKWRKLNSIEAYLLQYWLLELGLFVVRIHHFLYLLIVARGAYSTSHHSTSFGNADDCCTDGSTPHEERIVVINEYISLLTNVALYDGDWWVV